MEYKPDDLRRLQLTLVEIVKDIDRVCRENEITYFLDSGSCLGAVRHAGFIPWDDDMDLGMLRTDYDRFLEVAPSALGDEYVVVHPGSSDKVAGQFAKVWKRGTVFATQETIEADIPQGIFVDIFPYDAVCPDGQAASRQLKNCRTWQSVSYLYHAKTIMVPDKGIKGAIERAACVVAHGIVHASLNPGRIREKFEHYARCGEAENSGVYANMTYTQMGCFSKDVLVPPATLVFEGVEFNVPAKPIEYLAQVYGDSWSQLPPENERRNHAPVELRFGE